MLKLLVLQSIYGLSDPEPERQADDKIAFLIFSWFPMKVLDQTTIGDFYKTSIQNQKGQRDLERTPQTTRKDNQKKKDKDSRNNSIVRENLVLNW